jgi:hypothetical protein
MKDRKIPKENEQKDKHELRNPSLIQSVSTIHIRRLNMKRVHETTTDDYKRQHP